MGVAWAFTFNGFCLGDKALELIGLSAWSNGGTGVHYTVYYSLIFFAPAFLLALRFNKDLGAKLAKYASAIIGVILILTVFGLSV